MPSHAWLDVGAFYWRNVMFDVVFERLMPHEGG
ncbi:secretion activator protein, partial [Vibrio anguillarum]|nr:secretion activator protein [Vibrio anguillarum]